MSSERTVSIQPTIMVAGGVLIGLVTLVLAGDIVARLQDVFFEDMHSTSDVQIVLRDISRMLGVTLSMLVALIAIAIPLAANVYTPKLIELFVADRGNRLVLAYYVIPNAFVLWNAFVIFDRTPDDSHVRTFMCLVLALGGLLLLAPYIYYVMRFLIPKSIIDRMEAEVLRDLERATRTHDVDRLRTLRKRVLENVQYLGKITLRSVDRYDRDTVFQGLEALETVFATYQARKRSLPDEWFRHTRAEMLGLGPEVVKEAQRQRAGIEVAILGELSLVLPLAIGRLPEVVARIAVLTRRFGVKAAHNDDLGAREQVTLFLNTYLRVALQRRHSDTFYKFCFQYRRYIESLLEKDPEFVERLAFFLDYYGHQAVRMGMSFLLNVVAYDLAKLTESAFAKGCPCRQALLERIALLDRDQDKLIEMPGVVKAQIILAAKLRTAGEKQACDTVVVELKKVSRHMLEVSFDQIVSTLERNFWEIADRRRHLDHVEPQFRPALERVRHELLGPQELGKKTMEFLRPSATADTVLEVGRKRAAPTAIHARSPQRSAPQRGQQSGLIDPSKPIMPRPKTAPLAPLAESESDANSALSTSSEEAPEPADPADVLACLEAEQAQHTAPSERDLSKSSLEARSSIDIEDVEGASGPELPIGDTARDMPLPFDSGRLPRSTGDGTGGYSGASGSGRYAPLDSTESVVDDDLESSKSEVSGKSQEG